MRKLDSEYWNKCEPKQSSSHLMYSAVCGCVCAYDVWVMRKCMLNTCVREWDHKPTSSMPTSSEM